MPPQIVKERAYKLDPECWTSYSGKPREFKRYIDHRRADSLRRAERLLIDEGVIRDPAFGPCGVCGNCTGDPEDGSTCYDHI